MEIIGMVIRKERISELDRQDLYLHLNYRNFTSLFLTVDIFFTNITQLAKVFYIFF